MNAVSYYSRNITKLFFSWYPKDAYKAFMAVNIGLFSQYLYKFPIWSNDSGGAFFLDQKRYKINVIIYNKTHLNCLNKEIKKSL